MKGLLTMRLALIAVIACTVCLAAAAQEPETSLPHYVPHAVPSPAPDAPYLLPDKSVYVLANDLVGPYFEALDDLFTRTHPNIRIHLNPLGSEPAIAALTSNVSAFSPMGRDGIRQDLDGFKDRKSVV